MRRDALPVEALWRPLPVAALAVMALNDHVLRWRWPGPVTGKLSDLAAVLFVPALLTALAGIGLLLWNLGAARVGLPAAEPALSRRRVLVAAAVTAAVFGAINLSYGARDAYVGILDVIDVVQSSPAHAYVVDPTDLAALLFLPLAVADGFAAVRRELPLQTER